MATLGKLLGIRETRVCKTCGGVMLHPYRCYDCERRAEQRKAQQQPQPKKPRQQRQ